MSAEKIDVQALWIATEYEVAQSGPHDAPYLVVVVETFARLVMEACAKVCDEQASRHYTWASENSDRYHAMADMAGILAKAIRARKP